MDIRKFMSLMACVAIACAASVSTGCESNTHVSVEDDKPDDIEYSSQDRDIDYDADYDVDVDADEDGVDRDIDRDVDIDIDRDVDVD